MPYSREISATGLPVATSWRIITIHFDSKVFFGGFIFFHSSCMLRKIEPLPLQHATILILSDFFVGTIWSIYSCHVKPSNPPALWPPTNLLLATTLDPSSSEVAFCSAKKPYWLLISSIAPWRISVLAAFLSKVSNNEISLTSSVQSPLNETPIRLTLPPE